MTLPLNWRMEARARTNSTNNNNSTSCYYLYIPKWTSKGAMLLDVQFCCHPFHFIRAFQISCQITGKFFCECHSLGIQMSVYFLLRGNILPHQRNYLFHNQFKAYNCCFSCTLLPPSELFLESSNEPPGKAEGKSPLSATAFIPLAE